MKKIGQIKMLLFVFLVGVSHTTLQAHIIGNPNGNGPVMRPTPPPLVLSTLGSVTIVSSGGDAENSTWSFSGNTILPNSATNVSLNVADVLAKMSLGDLTIGGSSITVNTAVNAGDSAASLTLIASGNIAVGGNIVTNGKNITLWSDNDASGDGGINIKDNVSLDSRTAADRTATTNTTGGGKITLAGGLDDGGTAAGTDTLHATGMLSGDGIPDGYASNYMENLNYGICLGSLTVESAHDCQIKMYSGGGNIRIHGRVSKNSSYPYSTAVLGYQGYDINAGDTGHITMLGLGRDVSSVVGFDMVAWRNASSITSKIITNEGDINIIGRVINSDTYTIPVAFDGYGDLNRVLIASRSTTPGKGNITLDGSLIESSNGWADLRLTSVDVLAATGNIRLLGAKKRFWTNAYLGNGVVVGSKAGSMITTSNSNILLQADSFFIEAAAPLAINTAGIVSVEPSSSSFTSGLSWKNASLSSDVSGLTFGKSSNTANITLSSAVTIAGPITAYANNINVNENLNTTAGGVNGSVLLKARGNISLAASKSITTDSGDVVLWADSDASGSSTTAGGTIALLASTSITTAGGNIVLAGGADDGSNGGVAADGIPDGYATGAAATSYHGTQPYSIGSNTAGLYLNNSAIDAGAGNVILRGIGTGGNVNYQMGTRLYGGSIKGTDIRVEGKGSLFGASSSNWGISMEGFSIEGSGAIKLFGWGGRAGSSNDDVNQIGVIMWRAFDNTSRHSQIKAIGSGTISIDGIGGSGTFNYPNTVNFNANGIFIAPNQTDPILSEDGNITFNGTSGYNGRSAGIFIGSPVSSTNGNIRLNGNPSVEGTLGVNGGIDINGSVSTGGDINIESPGAVTQTAPLTAKGLGLHGTGRFTLTNTSNLVDTLAGGIDTAKLGSLDYRQTGNLSIGQVNPIGIHARRTIAVSTETGDITIDQDITTDTTSTDAIIINAGKSKSAGDTSGGNIIITGSPAITAGTGAIIKLFSGSREASTGLSSLVPNSKNQRFLVDETSTFSPTLTSGNTYALYRGEKPPANSLHFDGTDDYVSINPKTLDAVDTALTLEAWINPEIVSDMGIFVSGQTTSCNAKDWSYAMRLFGGRIRLTLGNGSEYYEIDSDTSLSANNWVHVAATYENNVGGKIYINGREVKVTFLSGSADSTFTIGDLKNDEINIGRSATPCYWQIFKGKIDEVRVWNVARSQAEISSGFCDALQGTETGLLSYYNFNQGVAEGNNASIDSLLDVTSGANNGQLKNFAKTGTTSNFVPERPDAVAGTISGSALVCTTDSITLTITDNSSTGVWGSTHPSVAAVDSTGKVFGISAGTDSIYYAVSGPGGCGSDTTYYSITVYLKTVITSEPVGATLSLDSTTTLSVSANGSNLQYAWYSRSDSSYDPTPFLVEALTDTYTLAPQSVDTTIYYYVIVTGDCGSDTSKIVRVHWQDAATFDGTVSVHSKHAGVYSDTVWVRARLVHMNKKLPVEGKKVEFRIYRGDDPGIATADVNAVPAFTDEKGFARSYIVITQDPDWNDPFNDNNGDSMHLMAYFAGDRTFGSAQKVENFNVKAETAQFVSLDEDKTNQGVGVPDHKKIKFNGVLGSGYIETTNNTVDVVVLVRIQEEADDRPGDITKANVRFELSPSGGGTPTYIDQRPDANGYVSAAFSSVPVGPYGSNSFTLHVTVGDHYRARLNSTLTVHKKGVASLFCGGGDIQIGTLSTGKYAADTGSVTSFTVGSKYNKTASKVQGKASLIFTSKGRTYEVNGSGTPTVTFDSVGGVASYVSAASITDITLDTAFTASTLVSPTNLTLSYNLRESSTDSMSVKVADGSTVWFTNKGAGSFMDRQELISGGMMILSNIAAPLANSASRCGPGSVTLTATPPSGATIDWYDAPSGGTRLISGSTSLTVNTGSSVTYYAESRNTSTNALSATRTEATVTIHAQPDAPSAIGGSRCGSGSVVLSATIPANSTIAWYSASTGGKALGTTSNYTTPTISATTNYYVESRSTATGCISATRTVATATINALPTAPVTTSAASCGPGSVTLGATTAQSGKQIEWYTASKGGTSFNVGTAYTISNLTATTTYYTQSKDISTGCASSSRTAVTATLSSIPAPPSSITGTVSSCPSSSTALTFTASKVTGASSYQWTKPSCATGSSTTNSISLTLSTAGSNDFVSVKAVNSFGCQSASKSVQVTTGANCSSCTAVSAGLTSGEITSRMNNAGAAQMNVYPNPNKGNFNLSLKGFESGPAEIRILDVSGSVVYRMQHNLNSGLNILPLMLNRGHQGVFLIQVMQKGKVNAIKLVKE